MEEPFSQSHEILTAVSLTDGGGGITNVTGRTIDMTGFDMVTFVTCFGAITTGAVCSLRVQRGNMADMSDAVDISGTTKVIPDTYDNKIFVSDVIYPGERYVRLMVSRSAQSTTLGALAIKSGARSRPVVQGADVLYEVYKNNPEG